MAVLSEKSQNSSIHQRLPGFARLHKRIQKRRQVGRARDLLEPEDRAWKVLESLLVDLESLGNRQHEARGAIPRQQPDESFQARALPEAHDFDEDIGIGGLMSGAIVGHPDPFASQLDEVGALADLPGRCDLAEPFDKRGNLGGNISTRVGLVGDQTVARVEIKAARLALGPQRSSASSRKSVQCNSAGRNSATCSPYRVVALNRLNGPSM